MEELFLRCFDELICQIPIKCARILVKVAKEQKETDTPNALFNEMLECTNMWNQKPALSGGLKGNQVNYTVTHDNEGVTPQITVATEQGNRLNTANYNVKQVHQLR